MTTLFSVAVFTVFPETLGRSLEAIAEAFGDKVVFAEEAMTIPPVPLIVDDKKEQLRQSQVVCEV